MSNQTAKQLAQQIVDDLRGTGYYADPAVLAPLFESPVVSRAKAGEIAQSVVTEALRRYARSYLSSADVGAEAQLIADQLRRQGID